MNVTVAHQRHRIRQVITDCTRCELSTKAKPVPFSGPTPAAYTVVGEAPGQVETRKGQPFVGPSGRLLRTLMRQARIDPANGLWANAVSCWPYGPPSKHNIAQCRQHLLLQVDVADTPFVLTAGQTALSALVPDPDLKLTALHGAVLTIGPLYIMPIYHPAYLLRDRSAHSKNMVVGALRNFGAMVEQKLDPSWLIGAVCVACNQTAELWDERSVPYCPKHEALIGKRQRRTKRQIKKQWLDAQGQLDLGKVG